MDILLVNPTAGNGRAGKIAQSVETLLKSRGVDISTVYTNEAGHAQQIARDAAGSDIKTIYVLGGDGTIIEAARGVYRTKTALGLIPAGTGNDFRRCFGIPKDWQAATNFALAHEPTLVDAGFINDRLFVNVCGAGFDTAALQYTLVSKRYVSGILAYLYGVIRAIIDNKPVTLEITTEDGSTSTERLTLFAVANGGCIGGGIPVSPTANPKDGLFDVVTIPTMPRNRMIAALIKLMRGDVLLVSGTKTFRCKSISIAGHDLLMDVDGEIISQDSAIFTIAPQALLIRA